MTPKQQQQQHGGKGREALQMPSQRSVQQAAAHAGAAAGGEIAARAGNQWAAGLSDRTIITSYFNGFAGDFCLADCQASPAADAADATSIATAAATASSTDILLAASQPFFHFTCNGRSIAAVGVLPCPRPGGAAAPPLSALEKQRLERGIASLADLAAAGPEAIRAALLPAGADTATAAAAADSPAAAGESLPGAANSSSSSSVSSSSSPLGAAEVDALRFLDYRVTVLYGSLLCQENTARSAGAAASVQAAGSSEQGGGAPAGAAAATAAGATAAEAEEREQGHASPSAAVPEAPRSGGASDGILS